MASNTSRDSIFSKIRSSWLPSRPSTPVFIILIALVVCGAFYYVDFSNREANFTKRAFRHLTLIGDTIALQTENYYKAILNAPANVDEQYIATFLPGVQYSYDNSKNYQENSIISEEDNYYLFLKLTPINRKPIYLKAPILSLLKDRRSTSIGSDIFNSVLLTDRDGRVVFQSNPAGPRIIQIDTLINYALENGSKPPDANKQTPDQKALSNQFFETSTFSNLLNVQIAGANYKLFLQPLYLKIGNTETGPDRPHYVLCGLIRSDQFFIESLRVPYIVIIWSAFCALLLAFCQPFLKVLFMKSRERFKSGDALRLCLFVPIIIFLLSLAIVSSFYFFMEDDTDRKLEELSRTISSNFTRELLTIRNQLDVLGQSEPIKSYPKNSEAISRLPDALKTVITSYDSDKTYPFFNSVFWMDPTGHHKLLWTVREKAPPLLDVSNRAYARNLFEKKFSYIRGDSQAKNIITLEPINSWITGENSLVSCIPHPIGGAGIVTKPLSLIGPYVPPGFGYAVINDDGLVMFHSEESRNLVENLFEETDMNRSLIGAAKNSANSHLDVFYKGKDYRFYVTSFQQINHLPWTLIAFREKNPLRIFYTEVLLECAVCFFIPYTLVIIVAYFMIRRSEPVLPTEYRPRYLPRWLWPDKRKFHNYLLLNLLFLILALSSLALIYLLPPSALFVPAITLPVMAMVCYLLFLKTRRPLLTFNEAHAKRWETFYITSLVLLFILTVTIPSLAFFKLCVNYEEVNLVRQEQLSLAAFYQSRTEKVAAAYQRINFPSAEKREEFLKARLKVGREALDSYEGTSTSLKAEPLPSDFQCSKLEYNRVESSIRRMLSLIHSPFERFSAATGLPKYDMPSDRDWHFCKADGSLPQLVLDHYYSDRGLLITSDVRPAQLPGNLFWWLCLAALVFLIYRLTMFASRNLFLQAFDDVAAASCNILPRLKEGSINTLIICAPGLREQLPVSEIYSSSALVLDAREACKTDSQGVKDNGWNPDQYKAFVLDHLEYRIDDDQVNEEKLRLLEDLVIKRKKQVFIISTVDPLSYLDRVQVSDTPGDGAIERRKQLVERWAEVLRGFSKCHYRVGAEAASDGKNIPTEQPSVVAEEPGPAAEKSRAAAELLRAECAYSPRLKIIEKEITLQLSLAEMSPTMIIDEVLDRAMAYYYALWVDLSIKEKLLLVQLAQEGFVNPNNAHLVQELVRKGLIIRDPGVQIFNESFRRFVASVEAPEHIRYWEQTDIKGGWASIRILFWAGLIGLVAFLLYTQRDLLQSGVALLTAVVGTVAGLLKVLDDLQKKRSSNQPEKS